MAELNIFHYHPGDGPVHGIDGRVKVLLVIAVVITTLAARIPGLAAVTAVLLTGAALVPLRVGRFLRELVLFGILAGIILISRPTLAAGAVAAWRFLLVVLTGMIFTATARPSEIHAVIFTILRPVPLVPHGRIAEHVSLTILFIPLLFDTVREIGEARKARLVERTRNPVRRIATLALPLLEALFTKIEEVALALEARGFDEDVVRCRLHARRSDLVIACAGIAAAVLISVFG